MYTLASLVSPWPKTCLYCFGPHSLFELYLLRFRPSLLSLQFRSLLVWVSLIFLVVFACLAWVISLNPHSFIESCLSLVESLLLFDWVLSWWVFSVLESVEGLVKVKFHFEFVSQVSSSLVFAVLALSLSWVSTCLWQSISEIRQSWIVSCASPWVLPILSFQGGRVVLGPT